MSQEPQNKTNPPTFQAICPQGHVHIYDKRVVCPSNTVTYLGQPSEKKQLSEVKLTCKEPGCQEDFYVEIDCEGYV